MARQRKSTRKLTKSQLRAKYAVDRKLGRALQKKGLLSSKANLSKAKPSYAVRKKISSLKGLFTGTQQSIPVTDVMARRYKAGGHRVIGRQLILDKRPDQRFKRRRSEIILIEDDRPPWMEVIVPPISVRTIGDFVDWIDADPERAQAMLPPGTHFAFTLYGRNSHKPFRKAGPSSEEGTMAEWLKHYPQTTREKWENFVWIRLLDVRMWRQSPPLKKTGYKPKARRNRSREYARRNKYTRSKLNEYMRNYRKHTKDARTMLREANKALEEQVRQLNARMLDILNK